jgi:glycosyltransferase involved in cell wall biosynthesis
MTREEYMAKYEDIKLLHIGLMVNDRDEGLSHAFRKATNYEELQVSSNLPNQLKTVKTPDIVFIQIQSDKIGDHSTVDLLKEQIQRLRNDGAFVINWTGDIRNRTPEWMRHFPADVTAFSNMRDGPDFLQIGIDPQVFKQWDDPTEVWHDVVFMGNNYGNQFPLGEFRRSVVDNLRRYNLGLYGGYPNATANINADPRNPADYQIRESKIYNNCKIAISVSHFNEARYTSDRLLRAMGSYAFTLSHNYPGIEQDFKIGEHLDVFNNIPEMHEKIQYYLSHPKEREQIAQAGGNYIHSNFTYHNMVENIIKIYEHKRK